MTSAGGYFGRKVLHSGGLRVEVYPLIRVVEACGGFVYAGRVVGGYFNCSEWEGVTMPRLAERNRWCSCGVYGL